MRFLFSIVVLVACSVQLQAQLDCKDALAEVNTARATRGLPPFQHDPQLCQAAYKAAQIRASRQLAGHLPESDFTCLPAGASADAAGCAAWSPGDGWGACCTYDSYQFAGAAWVIGSDGRRYMHLFVRGGSSQVISNSQPVYQAYPTRRIGRRWR